MKDYLKAVCGHTGPAILDVFFVSAISLAPLLMGRLVLVFNSDPAKPTAYWEFLSNGQLSFYSMGSLAAILLICFRKKLPETVSLFIGFSAVIALLFLMVLVGIDPTLNSKSFSFVGWAALALYVVTQITKILVDAMKRVETPDAFAAGQRVDNKTADGLAERKGVARHG